MTPQSSLFPTVTPAKLPVSVITGFLGSGKTTLLNKLLLHPEMANTAVIINEFGEVPLDGSLVGSEAGQVVTLANGCMCCVVGDDFESAMGNLYRGADSSGSDSIRRILIETSGLADPAPIIGSLLNSPMMASWTVLDSVITTVDAVHIEAQIDEHPEAIGQIAFADRLIVTKSDLVSKDQVTRVEDAIRHWNQHGKIVAVDNGDVSSADLLGVQSRNGRPNAEHIEQVTRQIAEHLHHRDHGENDHDHRHTPVHAFAIVEPGELDWAVFNAWFRKVRIAHGDDLLRMKGVLQIRDEDKPIVVHGIRHIFHPPSALESWQSIEPGSRLVFIVRDKALEQGIREGFAREVARSKVHAP